ncbi:MAG: 30S ribosomal protein S7 [Chlorobi bacterium]|nr:30S ribosomal protein S7 [Chlorobiota bacterium]
MPRKKKGIEKRIPAPDPKYGDPRVSKFINVMMRDGKKSKAMKIFYSAMEIIEKQTGEDGYEVWKKAMENVKPILEVRPRRVGGATYQVPYEVPPHRQESLAMRWIVRAARERKGKSMEEKLAAELIDASKNQGGAIKIKENVHRMAEGNKAFAHLRF